MISIIYKMTHTPTGKFYIGSLKDSSRFSTYVTSSKYVSKMMKEYPHEWVREIVREFENIDFTLVVVEEQRLIEENVKRIGWGAVWNKSYLSGHGRQYSKEANEKRNLAIKSVEVRTRISNSMKEYASKNPNPMQGKTHSEETRKKLSESHMGLPSGMKGKVPSNEMREKLRNANLGKKASEETRRKISNANLGRPGPWAGKTMSVETRNKMSESAKLAWEKRKCHMSA